MLAINRNKFWFLIIASIVALGYIFADILVPFFAAYIFAYMLQPLIDYLERKTSLSRTLISSIIYFAFIALVIVIIIIIAPIIYQQLLLFISNMSKYEEYSKLQVHKIVEYINSYDADLAKHVQSSFSGIIHSFYEILTNISYSVWEYTMATINALSLTLIFPIVLYYFLRDWKVIVSNGYDLLPIHDQNDFRNIFISINKLLSAYIRGQLTICLIMSVYYFVGLSLIGHNLSVFLALVGGFFVLVPFLGSIVTLIIFASSSYILFGFTSQFFYVILLFVLGHGIEVYVLLPKVIGNKIGLHPIWIMFAFYAVASLFGLVGILFAIPIAGIVKVLMQHFVKYYKNSAFYKLT